MTVNSLNVTVFDDEEKLFRQQETQGTLIHSYTANTWDRL